MADARNRKTGEQNQALIRAQSDAALARTEVAELMKRVEQLEGELALVRALMEEAIGSPLESVSTGSTRGKRASAKPPVAPPPLPNVKSAVPRPAAARASVR